MTVLILKDKIVGVPVNGKAAHVARLVEIKKQMDVLKEEDATIRLKLAKSMSDWEKFTLDDDEGDSFTVSKDIRVTRHLKDNATIAKALGKTKFLEIATVSVAKLEKLVEKNISNFVEYTEEVPAIVIRRKGK